MTKQYQDIKATLTAKFKFKLTIFQAHIDISEARPHTVLHNAT